MTGSEGMDLSGIGLDDVVLCVVRCKFAAVLCCAPCCGESTQSRLTATRLLFFSPPSAPFPTPSTLPKVLGPPHDPKLATCCYGALSNASLLLLFLATVLAHDTLSLMRQRRAPPPPIGCVHIAAGL